MAGVGCDCGTFNLICAKRGPAEGEVKYRRDVNAFLEVALDDRFTFNMLKASNVQLIEREKVAYIVGEQAIKMAYAFKKLELKRPMKDGCLNPNEKDAFRILMIMIHSLLGEVEKDKEIVYYSVPANALNENTDADYHQKVLEEIFKKYQVNGKTIQAYPINEGQALVYAELADKAYTGIGISFGAGMVNFCYSIFSQPVAKFALVNSGDWIDKQAAHATGETVTAINKAKNSIDLTKAPTNVVERAIQSQYRIMIEKTVSSIKKAILDGGSTMQPDDPVSVVLGGGTASPPGFPELVRQVIKESDFPMPIDVVKRPDDHLYAVSRGALIAAENAQ